MSAAESDIVVGLMLSDPPAPNAYDELKATDTMQCSSCTAEQVHILRASGPMANQKPIYLLRLIGRILECCNCDGRMSNTSAVADTVSRPVAKWCLVG